MSNGRHALPVQPTPVKPLWSNLVSTTELERLKSIFVNQASFLLSSKRSGSDCFSSSSSGYSCYLILACSFQASLCESGDIFICLFAKKSLWTYPLLHLGVISWCSNNLVFNPSLTAAWEATESCFHFWHLEQEQPTSGFDSFWRRSRNSIAWGVLQRNTRRQNHHYMVRMSWSREASQKYCLCYMWRTENPWAPLIWDQQGWHRCAPSKNLNPESNNSQSGL